MMKGMKRKTLGLVVALCALAGPSVASAHTGSVTCDARGIVFTYNANFERDTLVLETVRQGDVTKTKVIGVKRKLPGSDTWPGYVGEAWAGAKWKGGGIRWTKLVCPKPPPPVSPPVTPPVVPPTPPVAPPVPPAAPPAPVTPPAPPPVPVTPVTPTTPPVAVTPPKTAPKCPKGTTRKSYDSETGVLVCFKILRDHAVKKKAPKKGAKPKVVRKSDRKSGGVTG